MSYDPQRHHRHSIRLPEHDYSSAGIYFFTACTYQRECHFGAVIRGEMVQSESGQVVAQEWHALIKRFPTVTLDAFVVMPNHVHGIILLAPSLSADECPALGQVLRVFKSLSGISVNRLLGRTQQPLWQRNYYEHVIRSEQVLEKARQYILLNPERWERDADNPLNS